MTAGWRFDCLLVGVVAFALAVLVLLLRRPPGQRIPPMEKGLLLVALGLGSWLLPSVVTAYQAWR